MGRWEPDAGGRLQRAALDLYAERGYDQTTVADIAERAGLSERTFFRHFADKREVLFHMSGDLQDLFVTTLAAQPEAAAPIDAVAAAIEAVGEMFDARRAQSVRRQAVIEAHADLRERELIKMATLGDALAETLRARGVPAPRASLTAEAGIAVFRVAFGLWVEEANTRSFAELVRASFADLRSVTAGRESHDASPTPPVTA